MYRVTHLVANLGWVDLDLGSSPRLVAATVATYCPSRMVEHPKSKSTQPRFATRCVTLYRGRKMQIFSLIHANLESQIPTLLIT